MLHNQDGFNDSCNCYTEQNSYCPLCVDEQSQLISLSKLNIDQSQNYNIVDPPQIKYQGLLNYCSLCLVEQNKLSNSNRVINLQESEFKNYVTHEKRSGDIVSDFCELCNLKQNEEEKKQFNLRANETNIVEHPKLMSSKELSKKSKDRNSPVKNIPINKFTVKRDKPKSTILNFEKLVIKRFKDDENNQEQLPVISKKEPEPEPKRESSQISNKPSFSGTTVPELDKKELESNNENIQIQTQPSYSNVTEPEIKYKIDIPPLSPVKTVSKRKRLMYRIVPNKTEERDSFSASIISFGDLSTHRSLISSEPSLAEFNQKVSKAVETDDLPPIPLPKAPIVVVQKPHVLCTVPPPPIIIKSSPRTESKIDLKKLTTTAPAPAQAQKIWKIKYVRNDSYHKLK